MFRPPPLPRLAAALCAAPLLIGCAGRSIPEPTAKHVEFAEKGGYPSTLPSLRNGRKLYVNRCSGCHTLHGPAQFSSRDWPQIVLDMQSNAEINEDQARDVTRYLVALAAAHEASGAPRPTEGSPTTSQDPSAPGDPAAPPPAQAP